MNEPVEPVGVLGTENLFERGNVKKLVESIYQFIECTKSLPAQATTEQLADNPTLNIVLFCPLRYNCL